jgi:hypothetical protein
VGCEALHVTQGVAERRGGCLAAKAGGAERGAGGFHGEGLRPEVGELAMGAALDRDFQALGVLEQAQLPVCPTAGLACVMLIPGTTLFLHGGTGLQLRA